MTDPIAHECKPCSRDWPHEGVCDCGVDHHSARDRQREEDAFAFQKLTAEQQDEMFGAAPEAEQ
jgi:hypothetical protein